MRHSGRAQRLEKVPIAVLDESVYAKASLQITVLVIVSAIRDIANPLLGKISREREPPRRLW